MKSSSMPVFKKLNLGEHGEIAVFNAPKSFEPELARLKDIKVLRDPKKPKALTFALAFADDPGGIGPIVDTARGGL